MVAVARIVIFLSSLGFWLSVCDERFDVGKGDGYDLMKWFRSPGGSACDGVMIRNFDEVGMGLGIVASNRDVAKGEILLKAPPALVISHQGLKVVPAFCLGLNV